MSDRTPSVSTGIRGTPMPLAGHAMDTMSSQQEQGRQDTTDVLEGTEFDPDLCLFCNRHSQGPNENIEHMRIAHGLIIPAQDHLIVDIETLLGYMHLVIFGYFECLACGRQKNAVEAAQQHMIGSSHCSINHLSEGSEFRDFYDFDDVGDGHGGDSTQLALAVAPGIEDPHFTQHGDNILRLQSGRLVSHKDSPIPRHYRRKSRYVDSGGGDQNELNTVTYSTSTDLTSSIASGYMSKSRAERRDATFVNRQLVRLREADRRNLMHMPTSQQRALLVQWQKQVEKARTGERDVKGRLERKNNKVLMKHFVNDVPGRSNG